MQINLEGNAHYSIKPFYHYHHENTEETFISRILIWIIYLHSFKSLHIWMKVLPPVGILLERMTTMSYFTSYRKTKCQYLKWQTVSELTQNYMYSLCSKGRLSLLQWFCQEIVLCLAKVCWKMFLLVNSHERNCIPLYLKKEIHEHRFFFRYTTMQSHKMLLEDFPSPSLSLLSKLIKNKLTLLDMLKLWRRIVKYLRILSLIWWNVFTKM